MFTNSRKLLNALDNKLVFNNITSVTLSLYSTATQNYWRWVLLHQVTQFFCVTRRQTPDAKPKICVSPDSKPRCQSVEYRWRWVPTPNSGVGHVHFFFLCRFHSRWVANANPISSGIWALYFLYVGTAGFGWYF